MFRILLFLFFLAPVLLYAQGVAPLGADEPMRMLAAEVEVMVDAGGAMTLDDVLKAGSGFAPVRMPFSGGYTRKVHWFRITLRRGADAPADWLLSATPAYLDDLRFYSPDADGGFSVQQAGDRFAASGRPIDYQFGTYAFTLALPDTLPRIFYLRLQTGSTSALNLAVATPQALAAYDSKQKLLSGLILGALALLAINALMMGYWLRDSAYPLFAGYAFSGMLLQAAKEGLVGQYLFPTMPAIANLVAPMSSCLLAAFAIAFFSAFLEMRRYYPRLRYLLLGIVALAALTLLGLAFDLYVVMAPVLFLSTLLAFLSVLFVIWRLMCMKLPGSQPLFYGYLIYMSATIYTLLATIGLIPAFHFALAGSQVSLVLLLLFLQQGLYQRMRATEALHREAELRVVAAEKQALAEVQRRHAQSTFLNLVAHELKTPLAVIDSAIQVLEIQPGKPDDLAVPRYEIIRRAVSHLNGLLENTLSVERRENTPLQPRIELIAPAPFVAAIVRQVIPPGRHCDIHLQDDPPCAADRMLLKLALSNLLVNAVKYSPHDSPILLDISKTVVAGRERTLIRVSNLYTALEKPDCRIWFDKYYRQHELPNVEGLGLGLYLVREIARCHGGEVSCLIEPQPSLWRVTLSLWLPDMLERKT